MTCHKTWLYSEYVINTIQTETSRTPEILMSVRFRTKVIAECTRYDVVPQFDQVTVVLWSSVKFSDYESSGDTLTAIYYDAPGVDSEYVCRVPVTPVQ